METSENKAASGDDGRREQCGGGDTDTADVEAVATAILAGGDGNAGAENMDGASGGAAAATNEPDSKFHCLPCHKFLPRSDFYPSNIQRSIHRCRTHTREAARVAQRKAAALKKKNKGQRATKAKVTAKTRKPRAWRSAARRVMTLMRRSAIRERRGAQQQQQQQRSAPDAEAVGAGSLPNDDVDDTFAETEGVAISGPSATAALPVPAWAHKTRVVEAIVERFRGKSVISKVSRGLVVVPYTHATAQGEQQWDAWDSVLVTQSEAKVLAQQSQQEREEALGEWAHGLVDAAMADGAGVADGADMADGANKKCVV